MNHTGKLTYQPLGDPLFETYPWRLWLTDDKLVNYSSSRRGWTELTNQRARLRDEIVDRLHQADIEFRTFNYPQPNIRFRTEAEATFFLMKFGS